MVFPGWGFNSLVGNWDWERRMEKVLLVNAVKWMGILCFGAWYPRDAGKERKE